MAKETQPKIEVVTLSDYITKIGNEFSGVDKVKAALKLLYTENKVVAKIDRKGEDFYVVEK